MSLQKKYIFRHRIRKKYLFDKYFTIIEEFVYKLYLFEKK